MEVKINKEIREFSEAVFFGMSLRQCIFAVLACGVAVGLYFLCSPYLGLEALSWVCIIGAAPFVAIGFIKWHGMTAEQFIWAWLKSEILSPKLLVAKPKNLYYEVVSNPAKQKKGKKSDGQLKVEKKEVPSTPAPKDDEPTFIATEEAIPLSPITKEELPQLPAEEEPPLELGAATETSVPAPSVEEEPLPAPAPPEELPDIPATGKEIQPTIGSHSKPSDKVKDEPKDVSTWQPKHARQPIPSESEVIDSYAEDIQ